MKYMSLLNSLEDILTRVLLGFSAMVYDISEL